MKIGREEKKNKTAIKYTENNKMTVVNPYLLVIILSVCE